MHGGKEVGVAPRLNRESCPGNSCLHEVLVLAMGPVSQPGPFSCSALETLSVGVELLYEMGHVSLESQSDSTFVCYRISPALSVVFVLLKMMFEKLTKSFWIFVSNLFRKKILF